VSGTWDPVGPWYEMSLESYPSMLAAPHWLGPQLTYNSTYRGVSGYVDFHFVCRIHYQTKASLKDDGARFDVFLTFDSRLSPVNKTATPTSLDVVFRSEDINEGFGTEVCCCSPKALTFSSQ